HVGICKRPKGPGVILIHRRPAGSRHPPRLPHPPLPQAQILKLTQQHFASSSHATHTSSPPRHRNSAKQNQPSPSPPPIPLLFPGDVPTPAVRAQIGAPAPATLPLPCPTPPPPLHRTVTLAVPSPFRAARYPPHCT
ncbi:hypothetical protein BS78_01G414600, partial [Paspalum vaginatum]